MKVQRIDVNDRIDRKYVNHNQRRLLLKVDVIPVSGSTIGYFKAPPGVSIVEVWEDQVEETIGRLRTERDEALYQQARELAKAQQQLWLEREGIADKPEEYKADQIRRRCNETPEKWLAQMGVKGMPPLRSIRVCTRDQSADIPLEEWLNLSDAEREESFWIEAPSTQENIGDKQAEYLKRMTEMFAKVLAGNEGNAPKKTRGRG